MSLDDLLARDAKGILTDPDGVGELITWRRPATATEAELKHQVRATVNRLGRLADERGKESWQAIVFVPRDATAGFAGVRNGDELWFDMQVKGGSVISHNRVFRINSQDPGGFELECVK